MKPSRAAPAADCDTVVSGAGGAAWLHALHDGGGHVEQRLHLCRDGPQGGHSGWAPAALTVTPTFALLAQTLLAGRTLKAMLVNRHTGVLLLHT